MNKGMFIPLSEEDWKNIHAYYRQHSIFHNPEQAIKDLESIQEMLTQMYVGSKFKREGLPIQIIDEIVIEDGEINVHHRDIDREDGCGYCSPISTFELKDKIEEDEL